MAELYVHNTAYNYTLNNPIRLIDPNGMWVENADSYITDDPDEIMDALRMAGGSEGDGSNSDSEEEKDGDEKNVTSSDGGILSAGSTEQTLMLLGLGLLTDGGQAGAEFFQKSNDEVLAAALRNDLPTKRINLIRGRTSNFGIGAKWLGRGVIGLSAGISIYQGIEAYNNGDETGFVRAGLDLGAGLGTAAIGGPPGVALYLFYMGVMAPPPGNPSGYVTPLCVPDNIYIAPTIIPGL